MAPLEYYMCVNLCLSADGMRDVNAVVQVYEVCLV